MTRTRFLAVVGVVTVGAALAAACGSRGASEEGGTPPGTDPPIVVDWTARTTSAGTTPAGTGEYTLKFCEGDGPFLCVWKDGAILGAAELGDYPVRTVEVLRDALGAGATEFEALRQHAADVVDTFVADRADGCGTGYVVESDEPAAATVAGKPGLRYGWTATLDGKVVERVVSYGVIQDDSLYTLVVGGLEAEGCLERLNELRIADLEAVVPLLDRVAAGSRLPAPTAP